MNLIDKYKAYCFAVLLFFAIGCASRQSFYLRSNTGSLTGPLDFRKGTPCGEYTLDFPSNEELEIRNVLRTTILPDVHFSKTPLDDVGKILYCLQHKEIGDKAIPILIAPVGKKTIYNLDPDIGPFSMENKESSTTNVADITFCARYISLYDTIMLISDISNITHMDIRDGAVYLTNDFPEGWLPKTRPINDAVSSEISDHIQEIADRINKIQSSLKTPEYLMLGKSETRRFKNEFDVMSYFDIFSSISMRDGYTLDYVFDQWGMGCNPIIYARKYGTPPFTTEDLYQNQLTLQSNLISSVSEQYAHWKNNLLSNNHDRYSATAETQALCNQIANIPSRYFYDDYLKYIEVKKIPTGFLELATLYITADQFYMAYHAYQDQENIICTKEALSRYVEKLPGLLEESSKVFIAKTDTRPTFKIQDGEIYISIMTYSQGGYLRRRTLVLSGKAPHRILREESEFCY